MSRHTFPVIQMCNPDEPDTMSFYAAVIAKCCKMQDGFSERSRSLLSIFIQGETTTF